MRYRPYILFLVSPFLFSCGAGTLLGAKQKNGKNEFSTPKTIKNITVQWRFTERVAVENDKVQETYVMRLTDAYDRDVRYVNLDHVDDRKVRDNYLTFGIETDFYIQACGEVYPAVGCVADKTYGLTKDMKLTVTFELPASCTDNRVLIFDDRHFDIGRIKSTVTYLKH